MKIDVLDRVFRFLLQNQLLQAEKITKALYKISEEKLVFLLVFFRLFEFRTVNSYEDSKKVDRIKYSF